MIYFFYLVHFRAGVYFRRDRLIKTTPTRLFFTEEGMATVGASEVESFEGLLDKAGSALEERELLEMKRIVYGKPVKYV